MKSEFEIELLDVSPGDTVAPLCIRAGGEVFTRLFRFDSAEYDDYVEADPRKLAFWLVDNYWRLRWECPPTSGLRTTEWRLRHELTAIGEYAWPRLTIWGDGPEVWLQSVPDLPGIPGPVKFLDECSVAIRGASFETGVRTFLSNVIDSFSSSATDTEALRALNFAWQKELAESSIATWRKREAQCGFDVDEAPEELMYRLEVLAQDFGDESIGEATQAVPGSKGADVLQDCLNEARDAGLSCNFADVVSHFIPHHVAAKFELAWPEAESIAEEMRGNYGLGNGPLPSKQLFAMLGLTSRAFDTLNASRSTRPYGLRLRETGAQDKVMFHSRRPNARRFELARALGDAVRYPGEKMGPMTETRTYRQRFQRAFAQAFLCPFEGLRSYIDAERPELDDIEAAASHFKVSPRVILNILVNKRSISRAEYRRLQRDLTAEWIAGTSAEQ